MDQAQSPKTRPRIGISACLTGQEVRWDGGHKRNAGLVDALERQFEWVPVCPEVEMGLSVPREPMSLVESGGEIRLITREKAVDHTQTLQTFAEQRLARLAEEKICGYILKSRSPSCGREGVAVYASQGGPAKAGRGLFAEALLRYFPGLPVEDEETLAVSRTLGDFIRKVMARHRGQTAALAARRDKSSRPPSRRGS